MIGIIIGSIIGGILLVIVTILLTVMYKLFWVSKWQPLESYEDKDFQIKQVEGIKYLVDKGIPYKGDFLTTNSRVYIDDFNFSADKNCKPTGLSGEIEQIKLPDCYNKLDSKYRDYVGDVWYSCELDIKRLDETSAVRLNFEGCYLATEVYIDGILIGKNTEGYLPFSFDISNLQNGKHNMVLKVNNQCSTKTIPISLFDGHKLGWYHYSGLHKKVYVEYQPIVSVLKADAIPKKIDQENWEMQVNALFENFGAKGDMPCEVSLFDGKIAIASENVSINLNSNVCGKKIILKVKNPKLWGEKTPNLYTLQIKTANETMTTTVGFRKVSWGEGKIFINDKQTFLKGVCRHEDSGKDGLATQPNYIKDELQKIQNINGNFVRCAHYPHSTITFDMMDEMGLMGWDEVPYYQAGQYITHAVFGKGLGAVGIKTSAIKNLIKGIGETALFRDHTLIKETCQSTIKMIQRDFNHPSIISWSVGNENWSVNKAAGKVLKYLYNVVKEFDDSRACNYASICMPIMAQRYESSFGIMDWACVNEYYGWYYMRIKDVGSLAKAVAKKYPQKPFVITETGSDTLYGLRDTQHNPPIDKCSEDYQCYFLSEQDRVLSETAKNFSGFCVWVFKDFPCPEYDERNQVPFYNMKGLFDKDMNEKMSYKKLGEIFHAHDEKLNN